MFSLNLILDLNNIFLTTKYYIKPYKLSLITKGVIHREFINFSFFVDSGCCVALNSLKEKISNLKWVWIF